MHICLLSKFQLDILNGFQDMVNLMSNTLQTNFHNNTLSSMSDKVKQMGTNYLVIKYFYSYNMLEDISHGSIKLFSHVT